MRTTLTESICDLFEKQTTKLLSWRIYIQCKGRYSDKQTTKLHFRYASHVAFRYKTDNRIVFLLLTSIFANSKSRPRTTAVYIVLQYTVPAVYLNIYVLLLAAAPIKTAGGSGGDPEPGTGRLSAGQRSLYPITIHIYSHTFTYTYIYVLLLAAAPIKTAGGSGSDPEPGTGRLSAGQRLLLYLPAA